MLHVGDQTLNVLICYESLAAANETVEADVTVVLADERGLLGDTPKILGLKSSVARAATSKTPIYRSTISGYSAVITRNGRILQLLESHAREGTRLLSVASVVEVD